MILFAVLAGLGLVTAASAQDAKPCLAKSFKFAKVEAACKSGGKKAAQTMMKKLVKKAKASGQPKMNCKSCHDNLKTYTLTKNAVADLKGLL